MNKTAFFFLFFCFSLTASAQKLHLTVSGNSDAEKETIDSIGYIHQHENSKSILDEVNQLSEKLIQNGYIENRILNNTKQNDSTFLWLISLGKKTDYIHIYIGKTISMHFASLFDLKKDTLIIPFNEIESIEEIKKKKLSARIWNK